MKIFPQHKQQGFTLIEVLVAFVIATVSLSLLYSIHAKATRAHVVSEEQTIASALADSLINEYSLVPLTFSEEEFSGVFDDKYQWLVMLKPVHINELTSANIAQKKSIRLMDMRVDIQWQSIDKEKSFSLRTLRPSTSFIEALL